jgi:hypothetical protein
MEINAGFRLTKGCQWQLSGWKKRCDRFASYRIASCQFRKNFVNFTSFNPRAMKKLIVIILLAGCIPAAAQFKERSERQGLFSFFRMKPLPPNLRWLMNAPVFTTLPMGNLSSSAYWQGVSYTSYSENGRFRSTHSFDVQGQLRESRASFSLRKSGVLSKWAVQLSAQRSRPLFTYTIR